MRERVVVIVDYGVNSFSKIYGWSVSTFSFHHSSKFSYAYCMLSTLTGSVIFFLSFSS